MINIEFEAAQIAAFLKGEVEGNENVKVSQFSKIEEAKAGDLTFLSNPKYKNYVYSTEASAVLVNKDIVFEEKVNTTLIKVEDAYQALAFLMQMYEQSKPVKVGIDDNAHIDSEASVGEDCFIAAFAYISKGVKIGNNVKIYPNAFIGENTTIGDNTIVYANASIYHDCKLGKECVIHSGAIIGGDGFGFAPSDDKDYQKIPQIGNVILEDCVEIGANTTIDRATMGSTIIRKGVKLDNLIQVAHNVEIGEHTVIAAQTGISGSAKIGDHCMFGGQVGIAGHLQIAPHTKIGAQSGVNNNLKEEGKILMGSPVMDASQFRRVSVITRNLPDFQKKINKLEKELELLKQSLNK